VLRTGGRLVIFNMCPHDSLDWLYYDYFPEALTRDLADFWPPEAIVAEMTATGFADLVVDRDHLRNERNLATFLEGLRRRDRNSQLLTLSDTAYEAGLRRLESELADPSAPRSRANHRCVVTVRGDKPQHGAEG
jgi:hypothetical protein